MGVLGTTAIPADEQDIRWQMMGARHADDARGSHNPFSLLGVAVAFVGAAGPFGIMDAS